MESPREHNHQRRSSASLTKLKFALAITFVYMIVEAIGGWYTNSLALLADAGHMLTDVAALSLTLFAFHFARRPATSRKTYGYYRIEILAAFVNGIVLVLLSLWIIYEAVERLSTPSAVLGYEMTLVAAGGLVVNIIAASLLHADHKHDLNMRGAWLHVMGDLLGSVAAIIAGLSIVAFGWMWADAFSSIAISLIIIYGAWRLILESVNVLLEGTPRHIDLTVVETTIMETESVGGVHDLHVWTISSGIEALSAHITHNGSLSHEVLLAEIRSRLHDRFGIDHLRIQSETHDHEKDVAYICDTGRGCFVPNRYGGEHATIADGRR
ncbi:CDF family zinc transporter CzcD [soil metagenome]